MPSPKVAEAIAKLAGLPERPCPRRVPLPEPNLTAGGKAMQLKTLGLAVIAAVTLSGAASAQSVTIERHDNMRGDRVMRSESVQRMDRVQVREPRVTGTVRTHIPPGQLKKQLRMKTGREAMESNQYHKPGATIELRH
jgi:hypothetical protein